MKPQQQLPARPGQVEKLDPKSREASKLIDWVIARLDYSADAKREVEREAAVAYRHMNSYLDESRHPFPTKIYDPVFTGGILARRAKAASALFSAPPLLDYMPEEGTPEERARMVTAVMGLHVRKSRPRNVVLDGYQDSCTVGSHLYYFGWDYEEQARWVWQRVPRRMRVVDPITGQPAVHWVDDGKFQYVRTRVIVKDLPSIVGKHITQVFIDDRTGGDIQASEWIMVKDEISGRDARKRIKTDGWNRAAVELAVAGEMPAQSRGADSIKTMLDWQQEIGLRPSGSRDTMPGADNKDDPNLKSIEVLECWRRTKDGIERIVVLNRAWVCWKGMSPFGDGLYPFALARNYTIGGQFWGLSDYRIARWLIRGIQSMRNAGASEALLAAMPPLLVPAMANVIGMRWEPRSTWFLDGCSPAEIQWLQNQGLGRQIAHSEAELMQGGMDKALGWSDPGRGGMSPAAAQAKATTMQIAAEAGGMREKMAFDNWAEDVMISWGDFWRNRCVQFQDYSVQVALTGEQGAEPITVWPEDLREADVYAISTPSVTSLKEQHKRRLQEVYELALKAQEPNIDRRALVEALVDATLPGLKDKIMKSQEQVNAELGQQGMPPIQGGPPPGQGPGVPQGDPYGAGPGDSMQQMAADLQEAYQQ